MARTLSIGCVFLVGTGLALAAGKSEETFEKKIQPVLAANCMPCHSESARTSGFSIQSLQSVLAGGALRGAAVRPGEPGNSPIIQLLRGRLKPQMPPGKQLPEEQIAAIESWISGMDAAVTANKAQYWAFQKPAKPPLPTVPGHTQNAIDAF